VRLNLSVLEENIVEDSDVREIFEPLFEDPSPASAFNVKKPLFGLHPVRLTPA
jgi:hypothetical protein